MDFSLNKFNSVFLCLLRAQWILMRVFINSASAIASNGTTMPLFRYLVLIVEEMSWVLTLAAVCLNDSSFMV